MESNGLPGSNTFSEIVVFYILGILLYIFTKIDPIVLESEIWRLEVITNLISFIVNIINFKK